MTETMLDIKSVTVRYGGVAAVKNISLAVTRGDFVSLLGPSGCGKTTLLRTIAGYVTPDEGDIVLGGVRMTGTPPQHRHIGMVFQNYALFPHMTVAQNIGFALSLRRMPKAEIAKRVAAMLDIVRLPGFGERRPAQLSGGQQQRVALARALAFEPQLLLLDEPLGALDLRLRESMQVEIRRIQRETGVTTIFVTHDQGEALAMSDFIAVMNKGEVEQIDRPKELYRAPRTAFVADFVGKSNVLDAEFKGAAVYVAGVEVAASSAGRAHGACKLSVRPEHVRLSRSTGALAGRIESVLFLGTHSLVMVRTAQGLAIAAHAAEPWEIGQEAAISWSAEHARLLDG